MIPVSDINVESTREDFLGSWSKIVSQIKSDPGFENIPEILAWIETVLEENVPKGKQARGMAVCIVYRYLVKERNPELDFLCNVIAWICEIGQAAALLADDIMDGSTVRRGEPAWYTRPEVGLSAINDAFLLENLVWRILRRYFSKTKYYGKLLELLQDTVMDTVLGQSLDTRCSIERDISKFTSQTYSSIVKYKTSLYTFYQPVAAAMVLSGIDDESVFEKAKEILCKIGHLFQIQDDYLDCFGNPAVTGKIGTDILDNKCTWLMVTALALANPVQKVKLLAHYGTDAKDEVKAVYQELGLKKIYRRYEETTYKLIKSTIDQSMEIGLLKRPLHALLDNMYLRKN